MHLDLIDNFSRSLAEFTARIEVVVELLRAAQDLIVTIPGIATTVADVIIAETGADMSRLPTSGHLVSSAGTCRGSNESACRIKTTHTRPGNPYLKGALSVAALAASTSKSTYLAAKYRRVATRRGPIKAIISLEHAMLIAIWNMLDTVLLYTDPGEKFFIRLNPDVAKNRARSASSGRLRRHPRALGSCAIVRNLRTSGKFAGSGNKFTGHGRQKMTLRVSRGCRIFCTSPQFPFTRVSILF